MFSCIRQTKREYAYAIYAMVFCDTDYRLANFNSFSSFLVVINTLYILMFKLHLIYLKF
jgi:hypothetical protein